MEEKPTSTNTSASNSPQANLLEFKWVSAWRELLAYIFGLIILYDFMLAPLIIQIADIYFKLNLPVWVPNTTQGGGLFFICMSVVLGISSWGKFTENKELIKNL